MWNLREYRYASSPAEAVAMLRQGPGRGRYIAGGSDLLLFTPDDCDFVVDINGIGCADIGATDEGGLWLGAAAILEDIAGSELVAAYAQGALGRAARHCGNRPVRTLATIGGNICNALPSADMAPVLLVLDAVAVIADEEQQQRVPLHDFFTGPRQTVLADRLLTGLELPAAGAARRVALYKLTRSAEDISLVQVAVSVLWDRTRLRQVRIALGAVAPVPLRATAAEQQLEGLDVTSPQIGSHWSAAAAAAAQAAQPIDDQRATAEYRRAMVEVLTRRLLVELAAGRTGEKP